MASQPALKLDEHEMGDTPVDGQRIQRLKRKYQTGPAFISVQRARYYTESWKETEDKGLAVPVRIAMAMKNVYEKMDHYLDPDDRIAGYWCEHFLGIPIDIERGVFNSVLEAELDKKSIIKFRGTTLVKGFSYMVRKGMLREFVKNQKISRQSGATPLNMDFKTMSERDINPYQIKEADKKELLKKLLPFWKGRATVDLVEKELLTSGLLSSEMRDFVYAIPGNTSRQVVMLSSCSTIASYHAHIILEYSQVLGKGLIAMEKELSEKIEKADNLKKEELDFLQSAKIAMQGVIIYTRRLAEKIKKELEKETDPKQIDRLKKMHDICQKVPLHPADTFEEAVQSMWTLKTAVETAHPVYLHCFGRMDQILYPYYKKDLEAGKVTPSDAVELLAELLLKIMSQNIRPESNVLSNFYHRFLGSSPVTLAGITPEGEDATNDLTYIFLEATHLSKAITNVTVRIHEKTPEDVLLKVSEYLKEGTSTFSLFNDAPNITAMERRGFETKDANDYAVMGCVETTCPGKTGPMSANALQLAQLLDITLRNGDSKLLAGTIKEDGLKTGDPDGFNSFDELLEAFYKQAKYFMDRIVEGSNLRDQIYAENLSAPYLSAFVDDCLVKAKDVTQGGGKYVFSGISTINAIANLVDSLLVIKKLIFENKATTFRELVDAYDNNYSGYEALLKQIEKIPGKWGNGEPETDQLAHDVMKRRFDMTYPYRSYMDGPFVIYIISMITHTIDGRLSIAGPDGRRAATPYAASCNPYNVEKAGPTAALRSVAALPFEDVMGSAINMKFHPTGIGDSKQARKKWASLVKTYFKLGGSQLQPTVASTQMLRDAQENPDQYQDLIVKVGGYSTYFVDLGREIQEEVIARTEHGVC
ncbi:MAG: hypothetical protein GY864_11325 [Desulfobacterales bacterium]|nr:hypothetical protein [Desulfobacterales bacterium]